MNQVTLTGRLTRDPELEKTNTGKSKCWFTIAVRKDRQTEGQPDADFINCTAWDKTAENLCNYQIKGNNILVSGRLNTGSYEKQGMTIKKTDGIADRIEFLDKKEERKRAFIPKKPDMESIEKMYADDLAEIGSDDLPF